MILGRYILRHMTQGTFLALLILVSISLLFTFIGELDLIGVGYYSSLYAVQYMALHIPGNIVEFMPLAILIGTILSLGGLASNSEIIAMQAAGISIFGLLRSILFSALLLAIFSFIIADTIVPISEENAREVRLAAINNIPVFKGKKEIWLKDDHQIIHIDVLKTRGRAEGIAIYELDENGKLSQLLTAKTAVQIGDQWRLAKVESTNFLENSVETKLFDEITYSGKMSDKLLDALLVEPRRMSSIELYNYKTFLAKNSLDNSVESLIFWQKVLAPLTVIVLGLLAVPFILGSQRQGNTGQRLIIGILLGLAYMLISRLINQLGAQANLLPLLNALAPTLLFFLLAVYLLYKKQSHKHKPRSVTADP